MSPQVSSAAELPPWLPRYDLDIDLDIAGRQAHVRERVTFTNRHEAPAHELVFNAHSHYEIPPDQVGVLAKTLELMRIAPSEALVFGGPPLQVSSVSLLEANLANAIPGDDGAEPAVKDIHSKKPDGTLPPPRPVPLTAAPLDFHFAEDNATALVIPLPKPVKQGKSVTIEIEFTLRLPPKQGRWGQWKGVTYLVQWLPVLAVYDDQGWHPVPFIPWHQPFFNEAGIYTARVVLPIDQKVACSGNITSEADIGDGLQELEIEAAGVREFAFLACDRYVEHCIQAGDVEIKVLAFPEHEHYAKVMLRVAREAIKTYNVWFGPYPFKKFTIAESFFGWNGNECGGLVMIDERVFGMPHLAEGYVDYLVSHEICHQWWYGVVGTNGYAETWMDEGLATYFSHRLMNLKHGKNNPLLHMPRYLKWLPTILRENYRHYGLYGVISRGEHCKTVQEMPEFGHVVNLFAMTYDKGSRIVGMIEDRLGEAAFFDFMRIVYARYQFRILRIADFQRELEEYTEQSWDEFFQNWLYSPNLTDWCIDDVEINGKSAKCLGKACWRSFCESPCRVAVTLKQLGEITEPTVLGIYLDDEKTCQVRIPIVPWAEELEIEDPPGVVYALPDHRVRVEVDLPRQPKQITVDPDQVLLDYNPANNSWKPRIRWRFTPLYTFLDDTDLTNDYDKWNVTIGPWLYFSAYDDPWFTRATMVGARMGLYRTQHFMGGVYSAYRTDYRDVVMGVDAQFNHWPWSHTQVGIIGERRLGSVYHADQHANRAVVYGRYIFNYGSSLYLPPMQYIEVFGTIQDNFLPVPRSRPPGAERFEQMTMGGIHYRINYLTPYWDPEAGFQLDVTWGSGAAILGQHRPFHQLGGQLSLVKGLPENLGWFSKTRMAYRIYGAAGIPDEGEYFPLGGELRFRGFQMPDRQGSIVWVGSVEWRVPVLNHVRWDCADHIAGIRNVQLAAFYDVGEAYVMGKSIGGVAHAFGGGLRVDVAWFSFIERTIFRVDLAKTVNEDTPLQFWLGFTQPF